MTNIREGVYQFKSKVSASKQPLFRKLADGQNPRIMMITCADSRVDPSLLTQTEPGDIFVCRNAGNIVPKYDAEGDGTVASIEFALTALEITDVIVCGHSDCGAMKGAMEPKATASMPRVADWLEHSKGAVEKVQREAQEHNCCPALGDLIQQNILLQLDHLMTYPGVEDRINSGELRLHAWLFDIGPGNILEWDPAVSQFKSIQPTTRAAE